MAEKLRLQKQSKLISKDLTDGATITKVIDTPLWRWKAFVTGIDGISMANRPSTFLSTTFYYIKCKQSCN